MIRNYLKFNSNVRAEIDTNIKNSFTIQFYAKPTSIVNFQTQSSSGTAGTNANPYLMSPTNKGAEAGFGLVVGSNGIMAVESANSYTPCVCVAQKDLSNKWSWITVVVFNRVATIWVDGEKIKTGNTSGNLNVNLAHTLGGGAWGSYNGGLLELTYWDRALTDKEVTANVKKGTYHLSEGLIRYYKCDRGRGTIIVDSAKSNNLDIEVEIWDKEDIEFSPYKAPNGSGVMYAHKSYQYSIPQILHRGIKFKGKNAKGTKITLVGGNVLEGVDIGDVGYGVVAQDCKMSFGDRKLVDINETIDSTNTNEPTINKNIYEQIVRTFPPAKAFKSGSFDNYAFIINGLKWGNANFLAFPTSAVQKVQIRKGERIVTNDEFMIGDVRGYQVVQKNTTTEVVYGGELEVYPKNKLVEIAYVCFLDRQTVFNGFNNIFAPEYEFNNGVEDDDGVTRPPHAEVYDLYESFSPYKLLEKQVEVKPKVPIIRHSILSERVPSLSPLPYYEKFIISQFKVGDSFFYNPAWENAYDYNNKLLFISEEGFTMKHGYGGRFELNQHQGYGVYEAPFDIVDFKSIEQIVYEE